jgi:hypothetical protein
MASRKEQKERLRRERLEAERRSGEAARRRQWTIYGVGAPRLSVYANGKQIEVPANIGIDPDQPPIAMAGLHTHDESGTIHDEGMPQGATLGQFFEIWGVPFSKTELGPYKASGRKVVRMWVGGKPSSAYGDLQLEDGQRIVVAYGPDSVGPPPEVTESG